MYQDFDRVLRNWLFLTKGPQKFTFGGVSYCAVGLIQETVYYSVDLDKEDYVIVLFTQLL